MAGATRITRSGLTKASVDLSLAALYVLFARAHWLAFREHPRPSLVLLVLLETVFAGVILLRRSSDAVSRSPWDWLTTAGGTLAPLLLRPAPSARDLVVGEVIQTAGVLLAVLAALSLNRSFGLLPAHRGVKTGGAYRCVRHPLYLFYTIGHVGYLICNPTARNGLVAAVAFALQLARIANEERFLSRYPEYRAYQARTRWRILPYLY
jgi:protein-S-isoprenylcysteine O-methyltransferase Ste14